LVHSIMRQGRAIIQGSLEEMRDNEEVRDAYLKGS
jgi:ABC-type branched-subunit amino acid transport system ATPase component